MSVKVITATRQTHAEWLRLRNAVYTSVGYVEGIYIDPEYRESGLARRLLE